ncbi:hypothetical protein HU200_059796 [Digitaria exilis]|uniref:Uncharacterized protein n=1 Tax=Digitaria exilis TaxID=1010633 RepID=A0A835DXW1_9POAL|nr:hypothetical protein HU200_059796 [Digitaria exilis]
MALLMLVVASMSPDAAAVAARLLSGPKLNPCTHDPNNPGQGCNLPPATKQASAAHTEAPSSRLISVSEASAGPSDCSYNPGAPPGQCPIPPAPAKAS